MDSYIALLVKLEVREDYIITNIAMAPNTSLETYARFFLPLYNTYRNIERAAGREEGFLTGHIRGVAREELKDGLLIGWERQRDTPEDVALEIARRVDKIFRDSRAARTSILDWLYIEGRCVE